MKRIYQDIIYQNLKTFSQMAFLVGPRQVGKTTIAKQIQSNFKESVYLNFDIVKDREKILSGQSFIENIFPTNVLREEQPLVIFDEIHKYSKWKNYIKGFYDVYKDYFKIIVTGSARLDVYQSGGDSLMGRYFHYHIHPLSVRELLSQDRTTDNDFCEPIEISDNDFQRLFKYGGFPDLYMNQSDQFSNLWQAARFKQLIYEDIRSIAKLQEIYSLEVLAEILKSQAGQMLNFSNIAKKIAVTSQTISRWVSILDRFYYCFTIRPWFKNVTRSLIKEPKIYLWDWSLVENEGAKIENFVALHLLKFANFCTDLGIGKFELFYLRDLDKHEVDFLITKNNNPYLMVESKASELHISKSLIDFAEKLNPNFSLQSVFNSDYIGKSCFQSNSPLVVPVKTLLSQLI